jgi:hypothetical protein
MASKQYRHLRGKIPAFVEEPEYQAKIDEKKREIIATLDGDSDTNAMASMLVGRELERKGLYSIHHSKTNDREYEINLYRKALSQLLEKAMNAQGVEEVRLTSGELVSLKDMAVLSVVDKDKAQEWALENIPEMLTIKYKGLTAVQIRKLAEWGAKNKLAIEVTLTDTDLKTLGRDNVAQGKPIPPGMKRALLTEAKVYGLKKNGAEEDAE